MKRRHAAMWAGWVVGVVLVGCGSDTTQPAAPNEALQSKVCVEGSAEIGPQGGKLTVGPYSVTVPAGALSAPITLTIAQEDCGTWPVELGPDGTQFALPVLLEFDASSEPDPGAMTVAWWSLSNQWVDQTTNHNGSIVSASVSHFSRWIIH